MPSLWSAFSSSSSATTSPSNSPQKVKKGSKSFGWSFKSSSSPRRLTRQRKLRHLSDDEIGLRPQSMPVSPDAAAARLQHPWSRSAVPQPLPLPRESDASAFATTSSNGQIPATAAVHSDRPTYMRRGFFLGQQVEGIEPKFRLDVPARSAPGSGFSSPVLSPQRFSTGDLFHSSYRASALETSHSDRLSGSSQALPSMFPTSAEDSPLNSPKLQHPSQNIWNHNGIPHSHHKSLPETYVPRHESNNTNLHPLPLPPGASRPSQSPMVHHHMDKSDMPSVKGQWQKGKLIGRGTYGSVYIATHRETGALCAMKEVEIVSDDPKCTECVRQLEQEIKVLRQLKHPNIVQYYGTETIGDRFCIYLEYVHPGSINKYVTEHCGAMTERIVCNFTRHILSGLAYLHSTKTIHRDIKGANLLVNASGVVKLADFGLAKHLSGHAVNLSLKGSPHWMAPEVLQAVMRNDTNPDHACAVDIWSLGCTVIEMLTGKPPWSNFSGVQAMFNVLNRTPPIPETLSSEGKDFLKKCLQREPRNRPSAAELLNHPFITNLRDPNVPCFSEEFSGMNIQDTPHTPRDSTKHDKDLVPISSNWAMHEKLHNGETSARSHPEISDQGAVTCPSPRSTLEILHCLSPPDPNGSSSNVSSSPFARAGNNALLPFREKGKRILHLL